MSRKRAGKERLAAQAKQDALDRQSLVEEAKELREQNLRLGTALNNMRQALLLFDRAGRLVLFNRRYLQMYRLAPESVRAGATLRELLHLRKAAGTFKGDPDKYAAKIADDAGKFRGDPDYRSVRR